MSYTIPSKCKDGYFLADACQINGGFYAGVPAADDSHMLALIERTVAMRAKGYAASDIFGLSLYIQFAPACTCGNDYGRSRKRFSTTGKDLFLFALELRFLYSPVFKDFNGVVSYMVLECVSKLRAGCLRYGNQVFDAYSFFYLSAYFFGDNSDAQPFAGRINGC